MTQNICILQIH